MGMKTTYIYNTLDGIQASDDKSVALLEAEEPIIVKLEDDDGQWFLSVINPELIVVGN